MSARSAIIS